MADDDSDPEVLRATIKQMLADAIEAEERHRRDVQRRDDAHVEEVSRRDELHVAEVGRRDEAHIDETARRDSLHIEELAHRDELHRTEIDHINNALQSRDVIGQAKGIIMASLGCTSDHAFRLLVDQSKHENRKLVDIAIEMAERSGHRGSPAPKPGAEVRS